MPKKPSIAGRNQLYQVLSAGEAARLAHCHPTTIHYNRDAGNLCCRRGLNGLWLVTLSSVVQHFDLDPLEAMKTLYTFE